ncbi:MAG TPA: metallopeptidase family protein [Clostridiales bacterium]|jgi:hypothetical protein|nr:metallopeptidase family protein [Clostridiales bacterium]
MFTIEETEIMLNEVAEELPPIFYRDLNGGILLKDEVKYHPQGRADDLYIMGMYHRHPGMGRYIEIFYGSFVKMYGHRSAEYYKDQLRRVLRHEFRHHIEGLAGENALEIEDEIQLRRYLDEADRLDRSR